MKHMKRLLLWLPILVISLLIATGSPVSAAQYGNYLSSTDDLTVTLGAEHKVIDGVYEAEITLTKTGGTTVKAHVLLVKPDAKASFKPVIPGYYTSGSTKATRAEAAKAWSDSSWGRTGVTNMVKQYESSADALPVIAALNGDFSNDPANTTGGTGTAPRGTVVLEGNALAHSATADDEYFFGLKSNGVLNIVQRTTDQKDLFEEAICGGAYILRNGSLFGVENETDSRQRTGIALRTNGDVLLITVESGISVKQLAELMKASGCWNGINMDGGGSIHMSTKREGDTTLTRRTPLPGSGYTVDDNNERQVTSALMLVADDAVVANNVPDVETEGSKITTDKTTYVKGESINVTASTDVDGAWVSLIKADDSASATSYWWYYVYSASDAGTWCWDNGETYNIFTDGICSNRDGVSSAAGLPAGEYRVAVLTYADPSDTSKGYKELASSKLSITENTDPVEGSLKLTGASRTDKAYTGSAKYEGNSSDFYYGDSITVEAEVSGAGAEGAWVGIVEENDYVSGNYNAIGGNWYYVDDFKGQAVNLNYVKDGKLQNTPNYASLGWRWVVLVSDSGKLIDSAPFFNRTFNMDWLEGYENGATWGEAARAKISVEPEWTGSVANGKDQKPAVTIKRVNGHFGYEEDDNGNLIEITEEVLKEGVDYTIEYPKESIEVGSYNIKISFFPSGNDRYLSTKPEYYGLADGVTYHITESSDEKLIDYELNGGENNEANPTIFKKGEKVTLKDPVKIGYCFDGWYTTSSFEKGTRIDSISKDETNDVKVYAKWVALADAPYTIKYVLNGGDNVIENPDGYTGNTAISVLPGKRIGYAFEGWYFDEEFTVLANTIKKGTKGNLTLFAKYTKVKYDIDTDVENGKADLAAPAKLSLQLSTAKKGYDNVKISWSAVEGAEGYNIYYKRTTADKWIAKTVEGKTSYTTGNLYDGYKYNFRVVPFIKDGESIIETNKYKSSNIYTLKKISVPKLSKSGSKVKVRWTNINGETGYQISKSTKKNGTNIVSTYKTTTGKSKLVKATKGKKYYYKVRAYKSYKIDGKYVKVYGPWSSVKSYRR